MAVFCIQPVNVYADDSPTVKSFTMERAEKDVFIYERDYDEERYEGWNYNANNSNGALKDDKLTLTYSDDTTAVYVYNGSGFVNQADPGDIISYGDVAYSMHESCGNWAVGGDQNYFYVYLLNHSEDMLQAKVDVEITESPVKSIEFIAKPRFKYADDDTVISGMEGDKVIVTFKDETLEPETFIYSREVNAFVSQKTGEPILQNEDPFYNMIEIYKYEDKGYYVSYMGAGDLAEGSVYFAKSMDYVQASPKVLVRGRDSEIRTDEDDNQYDYYFLNNDLYPAGDKLIVTFENNLGESVDVTFNSNGSGFSIQDEYAMGSAQDDSIQSKYLSLKTPVQEEDTWMVGQTYSADVSWYHDRGRGYEYPTISTVGSPYKIEIREGDDPEDPEPSEVTISDFRFDRAENNALYFKYEVSGIPEDSEYWTQLDYYRDGVKTGFNDNRYVSGEDRGYPNYVIMEDDIQGNSGSFDFDCTLTVYNENDEIAAVSEPVTVHLDLSDCVKSEPHIENLPDQYIIGGPRVLMTICNYTVSYNWSANGSQKFAGSMYFEAGRLTDVTSSDPDVIKADKIVREDIGYDMFTLEPLKAGTTDITLEYILNGEPMTVTKAISVYDGYLSLYSDHNGTVEYEQIPSGTSVSYTISAGLRKYDSAKKTYYFAGDVSADTKFSVVDISYTDYATGKTAQTDKVTASFKGNVVTVKAGKDAADGRYFVKYKAEASGCVSEGYIIKNISGEVNRLLVNDDFYMPMKGQTVAFDPTLVKYVQGKKITHIISKLKISSGGVTIKDKSGNKVAGSVTENQLPLTIKATNNNAYLRVEAFDAESTSEIYAAEVHFESTNLLSKFNITVPDKAYTGKAVKPAVTMTYHGKTVDNSGYSFTYYNNKNIGTATVVISDVDNDSSFRYAVFRVNPPKAAISEVAPLNKGFTVKWAKVASADGYKVYRGSKLIKTIKKNSTVTYKDTAAATNGTKYTYKVYSYKKVNGKTYTGAVSSKTAMYLTRPAISSLKKTKAGEMTIKWKKNAKAKGYQIQYALNKGFTSSKKTVKITKAATVSKVITSLKAGKTYYVKIRSYNGSSWSAWSEVKNIKIS
ncbi:MAG: fibronectin type III domain-containing protein [Firmicutes bacterium]|nr:fibronectin type III domain-containing protein [Bacillota bacterium]